MIPATCQPEEYTVKSDSLALHKSILFHRFLADIVSSSADHWLTGCEGDGLKIKMIIGFRNSFLTVADIASSTFHSHSHSHSHHVFHVLASKIGYFSRFQGPITHDALI